jgi:uncharacterized protein involved in type VI secretion and phage assembly
MTPFFGKYRGIVTDNKDPLFMGRVRAKVNDVLGDQECGWATPSVPFAGQGMGFYVIPPVGSGVWIEFEKGDPDYPILSGSWWGSPAEVPPDSLAPPYKKLIIQTEGGNSVTMDDTPQIGGITLKTASGQTLKLSGIGVELDAGSAVGGITIKTSAGSIKITPAGIEIDNGTGAKIAMQGPQVDVNGGALTVI